jgi:ABC-2 type transport system ATP-binding protein
VISAQQLGKVFHPPGSVGDLLRGRLHGRPVSALTDVSLEVADGEVVCLMGENGAGKSTLLRILAGLLTPSTGRAQVAGEDVSQAGGGGDYRRKVALVVGDERSFMWALSGRQNLLFFGALHGLSRAQAAARADDLLDRVGLNGADHRRFAEYSRGMRQRLALARGLLGDPLVLLLDEPTLGLDPVGARDLRRFMREQVIRAEGRTALVASNDPAEVKMLGDRVVFLRAGRLHGEATTADIDRHLGLAAEGGQSPGA